MPHLSLQPEQNCFVEKARRGISDESEAPGQPDVKEQMTKQGYENAVGPAAKMNAQIRADLEKWGRVVKQAGIKPE